MSITPFDDYTPPVDNDQLDTYVERVTFDQAEHGGGPVQSGNHPLHGWIPDDLDAAEWAMRMLQTITREITALGLHRDEWMDRIDAAYRKATRGLEAKAGFFEQALTAYALIWQQNHPEAPATIHMIAGVVETQTPKKPTIRIADPDAVRAWLESPAMAAAAAEVNALRPPVPAEPLVSGVRKLVRAAKIEGRWRVIDTGTGEFVEGLSVEPPGPTRVTAIKPNA